MIRVPRKRKDELGQTIQPSKAWFAKAKSLTKAACRDGSAHVIDEKHYGADEVRKALEKLFFSKCAYCETSLPMSSRTSSLTCSTPARTNLLFT